MSKGFLRVALVASGEYEIYRIDEKKKGQLISEHVGVFNEDTALDPGNYLVLADCSYEEIYVRAGSFQNLTAHRVEFTTLRDVGADDKFTVQCTRNEKFGFRQNLRNVFTLNVLSGSRVMLVGMRSFHLDSVRFLDDKLPKAFKYALSSISVRRPQETVKASPFFVSPNEGTIAITEAQKLGGWQFLVPGVYSVELNGTERSYRLQGNQSVEIEPALILISAAVKPASQTGKVRQNKNRRPPESLRLDSPHSLDALTITINQDHLIEMNEITPVLEGSSQIALGGSHENIPISTVAGALTEIKLKSVYVDLGCSPWERSCLGKKEVLLFRDKEYYPFMQSFSDREFLYAGDVVHVGFLSSGGIRYELPKKQNRTELKVGIVRVIPDPVLGQSFITDLVRLESKGNRTSGHTQDIPSNGETSLTLVAGVYRLVQYHTVLSSDAERWLTSRNIVVKAGQTVDVRFPYYLPERHYKQVVRGLRKKREQEMRRLSRQYQHVAPARRY